MPTTAQEKSRLKKDRERAAEKMDQAILCFAQGVNNDFDDIRKALLKDNRIELVRDLEWRSRQWHDASEAFLQAIAAESFANRRHTKEGK